MARIWIGMALAFALVGCVEEPPGVRQGKTLSPAERAECLAAGGSVGRGGLLPDEICFRPLKDAGKVCTKATDCEGVCLASTRTCSKVEPMSGCYELLDGQGRQLAICVD
ncbi:hypothetical protein [Pseudogemmobacter humi]|uniref:Uncharacterized protein n=1 Tax=Pseudogemmobacter humi TaxID=2483812 RepID=A0A3P5WZE8_9RHOB|nr:hypothetical protein [Pseudogemmobacter humi]VDC27300.1 hypothetical protein XINFAN_01851 [Pseudogemmobacter humi]